MKTIIGKYLGTRLGINEFRGLKRIVLSILNYRGLLVCSIGLNIAVSLFEGGSIALLATAVGVLSSADSGVSLVIENFVLKQLELLEVSLDSSSLFIALVSIAILCQILRSGLAYGSVVLGLQLSTYVRQEQARNSVNHSMSLKYEYISRYPSGEVAILIEQTKLSGIVVSMLSKTALSVVMLVGYCIVLLLMTPASSLLVLAAIIILWLSMRGLIDRLIQYSKMEMEGEFTQWRKTFEYLNAPRLLRVLGATRIAAQEINSARDKHLMSLKIAGIVQASVDPILEILVIAAIGVCVVVGYILFGDDYSTKVPALFVYLMILVRVKPQIIALNQVRLKLARTFPRLKVAELFLTMENKEYQRSGGLAIRGRIDSISFDKVSYSHPGDMRNTLTNISFEVLRGQFVALVGVSGAGKTTITNLLLGLYDPSEGSVRVNGRDLKELDLASWLANVGTVAQDEFLLNGTISDNIAFGRPDATDTDIEQAAKLAGAHEFILDTERGYDTTIGDRGLKLSEGQKQRVALGRALLRDPQILVLDEATSALDIETEKLVQNSIISMRGNRTILVIAHRLSTVIDADLIIVLENGEIVESGTLDELLHEQTGRFMSFWTQSGLA